MVCKGFNQILTDKTILTTLTPRLKLQVPPKYVRGIIDKEVQLSGFENIFYEARNLPLSLLSTFSGIQVLKFNTDSKEVIQEVLKESAKQTTNLKSLELNSLVLDNEAMQVLTTLLQPHTPLQEIILNTTAHENDVFSEKLLKELIKSLATKPNLQKFVFRNSDLTTSNMQLFIDTLLKPYSKLQELDLSNNRDYLQNCKYDMQNFESILSIQTLRKLSLNNASLADSTTEQLLRALIQNITLQELSLTNNHLTATISKSLQKL